MSPGQNCLLIVDVGTTAMKASLYGERGQVLHTWQIENPPHFFSDGRVEQDPASWQHGLVSLLKAAVQAASAEHAVVQGLALTAQRSSVIAVDRDGLALHPAIMWQDGRCAPLVEKYAAQRDWVYGRTGTTLSPVFSALKMDWLHQHESQVWQQTYKLLGVQDWLLHTLTGRYVTDESFGSRTSLMNLHTRSWDAELLALFEIPIEMLCELVPPGSVIGGLTAAMAQTTGLPQGLPVISAAGDQQCAALGLGLLGGQRAVSNTGTGSYLIGHCEIPALDAQRRVACNASAMAGAYIVEASVLTSGTIYRWFAQDILHDQSTPDLVFESINAQAAQVPAGANGLLLLPHFKGCGAPYWDAEARGMLYNLSLSTTRGEIARAILEGIAGQLKESLEIIENLCGAVTEVRVSGGLSALPLFNQIQADVFERRVLHAREGEATARGAWMAACVATGMVATHAQALALVHAEAEQRIFEPLAENRALYRRQRARMRALYETLSSPALRAQLS